MKVVKIGVDFTDHLSSLSPNVSRKKAVFLLYIFSVSSIILSRLDGLSRRLWQVKIHSIPADWFQKFPSETLVQFESAESHLPTMKDRRSIVDREELNGVVCDVDFIFIFYFLRNRKLWNLEGTQARFNKTRKTWNFALLWGLGLGLGPSWVFSLTKFKIQNSKKFSVIR